MRIQRGLLITSIVSGLVVGVVIAAAWLVWPRKPGTAPAAAAEWTCSMHPEIRQPRSGRCPICGMDLVPVTQLSAQETLAQRAGLETEVVGYRELFKEVRTVGKLDYNESRVAYITARIAGRVDRLYADFTGIQVKKGDHLVDIYSPDLLLAQDELIRAADAARAAAEKPGAKDYADNALELARTKLRLWGILPEQLAEIEKSRQRSTHLTIYAPIGGTVIEKSVHEQQYVKEGDMLYRIADLDPIWLYLEIYEYDQGWVRYGQAVDVTLEAYPGESFRGIVTFIDPFLDDKTRTVKARVNLKNPEHKLKPAMYASASIRVRLLADGTPEPTGLEGKYICRMHPEVIRDEPGRCPICAMVLDRVPGVPAPAPHEVHDRPDRGSGKTGVLAVPTSAVLDTGRRKVVYRQTKAGNYELAEIRLGPRAEAEDESGKRTGYYPVLSGLKPGDRVVVRGGFLLDSQTQIEGRPSLLYPEGQGPAALHSGHGGAAPPQKPASGEHKH